MELQIQRADIEELILDPRNPRLGLRSATTDLPQGEILDLMRSWSLEELATSFLENGFWPQEALLCVQEEFYGRSCLVVAEGNRRLAALMLLKEAFEGRPSSLAWARMVEGYAAPAELFANVPYLLMPDRKAIDVFLGFRHVTGIKEWQPAEKAEYIAFLIDERGMTYRDVMRKIGSKTEAVRRNYIAYRLLSQMKDTENVDTKEVLKKFSVLFLSLRTSGVQQFLGVNINAEPEEARTPVPADHIVDLIDFSRWLFGDASTLPIVPDSRQVERFAKVLQSAEAVKYLRSVRKPSLDYAYVLAGGEEQELAELIEQAAYNIEQALSTAHLYASSDRIVKAARRVTLGADRLAEVFPVPANPEE